MLQKLFQSSVQSRLDGDVIIHTPSPDSSPAQIASYINKHINKWAEHHSMWDMRAYDFSQLAYRDVSTFLSMVQHAAAIRTNLKTAFLVETSLAFGVTRMFMTMAEGRELDIHFKVFEVQDQALQWLHESEDDEAVESCGHSA